MAVLGVRWVAQVPEQGIRDGAASGWVLLQESSQPTSTKPLQAQGNSQKQQQQQQQDAVRSQSQAYAKC
jgi:hypothetical protein